MGMKTELSPRLKRNQDMVVPATLAVAIMLVFPPLQTQAWWLILPCLVCLILRWHTIAFLLLFAAITYADSMWSIAYFLVIILLLFMRMHSRKEAGNREQLSSSLRQLVLTIPVLLIIMVLVFAAGSQWTERNRSNRSSTGISDSMTPGTISDLVNDSDLAMRVRFDSENNLQSEDLYWRGLVFENFDGQTWSRSQRLDFDIEPIPAEIPSEARLRYLVTLEPTRQTWLYGLHQAYPVRPQTYRDRRGIIVTSDVIRQRVRYPVTSIPPQAALSLSKEQRERNLSIPEAGNPQSRTLGDNLREQFPDDQKLINAVLQYFNQEPFIYTLQPDVNSEQRVDDFLFNTKEGFCEHYAGAMTFLLRSAGIPARVVVGYQGGSFNNVTSHWQVSQYNAHAWVEAWLPNVGWQRFDPTAAVAPERVVSGLDAWLASLSREEQQQLGRETRLRLFMNSVPGYQAVNEVLGAMQYGWNLGMYDNEGDLRTEDLATWLDRKGLEDLPVWLLVMVLTVVALRAMVTGRKKSQHVSPIIRDYYRLNHKLSKAGLGREPSETIISHMQRVAEKRKDLANQCDQLGRLLSEAEYGAGDADNKEIRKKVADFRLRKPSTGS